jgi:4'-phosphopantetheinyl transferase
MKDEHPWDDLVVWRAEVPSSPAALEALADTLIPGERAWAERLAAGGPRERFVAGRAALRKVLARYLGLPPAEVPLRSSWSGRLELAELRGPPLHFSVSHSGAMALLAISPQRVGVDLEGPRQLRHALEVAARTFARSELELLARIPSGARPRRFLEIWTAKEAVLKASGAGLPGLAGVEVSPGPDGALAEAGSEGERWEVRIFEPAPGYVAAAASVSLPDRIEVLPLPA